MNCDIRWAASRNNIFYARMFLMPRDGAIIFSDLIGKLEVLCVQSRPSATHQALSFLYQP